MNLRIFLYHLRVWIFPLVLVISGFEIFSAFAESQLRAPGGFRDTEFWLKAARGSKLAADLMPLSGYLHEQVGKMLVEEHPSWDAVTLYSWLDQMLRQSDPSRRIPDVSFALNALQQENLLAAPGHIRLYLSLKRLGALRKKETIVKKILFSDSAPRLKGLRNLIRQEKNESTEKIISTYEKINDQIEFEDFQAPLFLRLAYLLYERGDFQSSGVLLRKVNYKQLDASAHLAATRLRENLSHARGNKNSAGNAQPSESLLLRLCDKGLFGQVQKMMHRIDENGMSDRLLIIKSWLNKEPLSLPEEKRPFYCAYYAALHQAEKDPLAATKQLLAISLDKKFSTDAPLIRFAAWGLAYFEVKNYSWASYLFLYLKTHDPLSPYGQLDRMPGLLFAPSKTHSQAEIKKIWQKQPYRFDYVRDSAADDFFRKGPKHRSQTTVHEGHVLVVNYDKSGVAEQLMEVNSAQTTAVTQNPASPAAEGESNNQESYLKMSWIDQFFYNIMIKFVPLGVKTFKEQVWKPTQELKNPIFERFYSESEFQSYVLDKMKPAVSPATRSIQARIDEKGFNIYAFVDLRIMMLSVSAQGKLIPNGEDGRLLLRIDHVKVGKVMMPKWILQRVEKSFGVISAQDKSPIDILNMIYQEGGILIKCRRKLVNTDKLDL